MKVGSKSLLWLGLAAAVMGVTPAAAKTLVYCSEGSPENFTPAINTTGTSFDAARPIYDQLVLFERGSTKVMPGLAESWEISDGGTTYTFKLRKGVKFHAVGGFKPTRDFNADDVLWSFNRQWKPDHAYAKVSGGKYDYFSDMDMPKLLKSLDKVDDYTVKMVLTEPNAPMIANLAMDFASIHSAEYADYLTKQGKPEQMDQVPIGTGPFSFVTYQKDAVIRFKANPNYWGEKAKVDDLVYAITQDPTARYSKLKAGECHFIIAPRPGGSAGDAERSFTQGHQPTRPQYRNLGLQCAEIAARQEARAPSLQYGNRQGRYYQRRLSRCGPSSEKFDTADNMVVQR
jgi:dipeptide transport system substrate-binding protein